MSLYFKVNVGIIILRRKVLIKKMLQEFKDIERYSCIIMKYWENERLVGKYNNMKEN